MKSILSKLNLLVFCSVLLVGIVSTSLWSIKEEQQSNDQRLANILQIQLGIDMLRSQLWVFLQYEDKASLEQVYIAQQSLSENLSNQNDFIAYIKNLQRMNHSLAILLRQERSQDLNRTSPLDNAFSNSPLVDWESRELLHSRYNMIAQSMGEELFHLQQEVHVSNRLQQEKALATTALILLFFSGLVSLIAILIFKQFKVGQGVIREGIHKLSIGDLDSLITQPKLAEEYSILVKFFNEMKVSLQRHIVTKDELEQEVKLKTSALVHQTDQLRYLSERDPLTGVLNRRAFHQQLEQEVENANKASTVFALLFIDLDKFKVINDTKGHHIGDEVLVTFSARLRSNIRPSDIIGRLGGDEFVICLSGLHDEKNIERKITSILEALDQPMEIEGESISMKCSIGVSYYPIQSKDINEVLDLADQAMYEAKKQVESSFYSSYLRHATQNKVG
ncbi:GGDEF domain-containing protein [Vibrio lamellibrachiae]|uniref:GGDEF domain-containing protein n=1 Tax=Vibrio lamellibrachiae TaxID=2910253 RepID=UPI003D137055